MNPKRIGTKLSLVILFFATLVVAGCGNTNPRKEKNDAAVASDKMHQNPITGKYWKLVMLEGQKVTMAPNQERETSFMFKNNPNQVRGFAGCNTLNGTYTLEKGQRIRFSPLAATLKACPDVDASESEFFEVFELADNYSIKGDTLSLNVGRRAPLAVFEAVYF